MKNTQNRRGPLKLGETQRLKRYIGSRKKEKGKRRCNQEDLENIVKLLKQVSGFYYN
jgi:hypothetical protein